MRFHKIRSSEMFESPAHEDNGVSIGDVGVYYVEDLGDYLQRHAQPCNMIINNNEKRELFDLLCKIGDLGSPDQITLKPGLRTDRMYISCMYL